MHFHDFGTNMCIFMILAETCAFWQKPGHCGIHNFGRNMCNFMILAETWTFWQKPGHFGSDPDIFMILAETCAFS